MATTTDRTSVNARLDAIELMVTECLDMVREMLGDLRELNDGEDGDSGG